ncbi:orotate phosphoribosyltransferase [Romeria aff. gracilis LEGE 07310]|uniref:Orotate phosphoribosyltransferase n=1 Tax=Vasconcelosia minhoensis LEGE 07310 TaxID=915328 RepID=A0A8J7AS54_9CYAN|nr:orotate phosphoribosyltransferase [Romeria gracilis]MBE9079500.1 orotate phosphoribosyltransferase [Romeria aff. gracilis LEGE 07310]
MTLSATSLSAEALPTVSLTTLKSALLNLICQVAYKEGDFTLSSGQHSDYYINGKQVTLHPQGGLMVGRLMLARLPQETVGVGGLTLGADPLVTAVSIAGAYSHRPITPLIVRKAAKEHGTQANIEGPSLPPNSPVVVLEDVVTTGQSAMQAVERLRAAGYSVTGILALVDRQQGGAQHYAQAGLPFEALFTVADLRARWQALHR